ncbi:MAG: adenylate/guanylate cyclase domain-containing protein [Nitrospira sp. WS110]|nr:adenylate/guanylate cyclase domain-containing protein [Nitrospira sp. WS110]
MMNDPVLAWLERLGLECYREAFQKNAISWDVLPELTDDDLISLGVLLGHRKKLLRALAQVSQLDSADGSKPIAISPSQPQQTPAVPATRGQAERRQLTVMFCDLVGSTALARRMDPEDLQTAIRHFLDTCSRAISQFSGYIAKYMGDGLLIYFGYPHAYEHDAERAVHAGLSVLDLVKARPQDDREHPEYEFAVRIGIATGHVIVGEVLGEETARERSVFGETPNLAARLQALAASNQLMVDSTTKRLVGGEFEFADHGTHALKGFDTPVQVWQVLSTKPSVSRFESYRSGRLVPFIGREYETALLLDRWREAVDGGGQVVLLCGEAGIGKSRLILHLRERLARNQYEAIQCQCSPHHTNTALYPVTTYLRQAAELASADSVSGQLHKLAALMANSGLDDRVLLVLAADLLAIPRDERDVPLNVSSEKRRSMTLDALTQYLQSLADRSPVLLIVEDAHWLDPTTLDLMTRIIDHVKQMRVLVLMTFRPDFRPTWVGYSHVTFLTLSRLPRRHSVELIATMTGGKILPQEVQQAILEKTDGVPLYIEALTESLLEAGLFAVGAPPREIKIPDSLQALLMERVDRLGAIKEIVQIGAAIGREFSYGLLREVVDVTDGELEAALQSLEASGLIFQDGNNPAIKYLFKHALIQDAAYSTLSKKSRRALHARIARALESRFVERVKMEPELLAYHYEQAGEINSAVHYWYLAAHRDAARSEDAEALSHFNRTLHLLKMLPQSPERNALELELLIARGAPLLALRGYASDEIEHNYLRAKSLSQENPSSDRYFLSIWGLWVFHLVRGPLGKACTLAESLLSWASHQQSQNLLTRAHVSVGSTYFFLGRFGEAKAHLCKAKSLYDPGQQGSKTLPYTQDPGITARIMLARTLWILGEVDGVETLVTDAIGMARELEHPYTLTFTLVTASRVYSILRDVPRTLSLTEEAITLSTKNSFEVPLAWAISLQGWALAEQGKEKGLERLAEGLAAAQRAKTSLNNTHTLALLAENHLRYQHIAEGLVIIQQAQELAISQGELCWQAELLRLKGELLLAQSDQGIVEAEQCFSEALIIAQAQHATMLELRAATSLARLLRKLNKSDLARRTLSSVRSKFGQQGVNSDLLEAQAVLDSLL